MSNHTPYDPNQLKNFDRYGNARYELAATDSTRAPYVLLAILALVGLVGSALYFSSLNNQRDLATAPELTTDRPAERPGPMTSPPLPRPDSGVTPPNQVTPAPPEATPARPE